MALTAPANIAAKVGKKPAMIDGKLEAGYKTYAGAIVVLRQASGYALPGYAGTGCIALGVAEKTLDNTSAGTLPGANTNGGLVMPVKSGTTFGPFQNAGAPNAVAVTDRTKICYILDDATVTMESSGHSVAGVVEDVTTEGVWVTIDPSGRQS